MNRLFENDKDEIEYLQKELTSSRQSEKRLSDQLRECHLELTKERERAETLSFKAADLNRHLLRKASDAIGFKAQRDALIKALKKIDYDLEGRNFLENSSLRDTARSALREAGVTNQ